MCNPLCKQAGCIPGFTVPRQMESPEDFCIFPGKGCDRDILKFQGSHNLIVRIATLIRFEGRFPAGDYDISGCKSKVCTIDMACHKSRDIVGVPRSDLSVQRSLKDKFCTQVSSLSVPCSASVPCCAGVINEAINTQAPVSNH